jgi:alpha-beta hydrolase superfamily lysophospholipase
VRFYLEAANAALEIIASPRVDFPILFAYGEADEVTSCKVAEDYFTRLQAPSKMFKIYPALRHELHNEPEREQVLADYVEWMKAVIRTGSLGREEAPSRN